MKTRLFLLTWLVLISVSTFAQRVLTDEERISLQGSSDFLQFATKAVENYAVFRSTDDGFTGVDGTIGSLAEFTKRAKDRIISVNIVKSGVNDPQIAYRYIQLSKGKQFSGLTAAPASTDSIVDAWVTALTFEEYASAYFDILGESIDFTIGGN